MSKRNFSQRIAFKSQKCVKVVELNEILYCKADGPYTTIFLSGDRSIHICRPLVEVANELGKHHFFRINRQHLVNLTRVMEYTKNHNHRLVLDNGEELCISKRNIKPFQQLFNEIVLMI